MKEEYLPYGKDKVGKAIWEWDDDGICEDCGKLNYDEDYN